MLAPFTNTYKRVRKSFIENKIFKMNEEINTLNKQFQNMPNPKVDEIENKKRVLIEEYKKLEK